MPPHTRVNNLLIKQYLPRSFYRMSKVHDLWGYLIIKQKNIYRVKFLINSTTRFLASSLSYLLTHINIHDNHKIPNNSNLKSLVDTHSLTRGRGFKQQWSQSCIRVKENRGDVNVGYVQGTGRRESSSAGFRSSSSSTTMFRRFLLPLHVAVHRQTSPGRMTSRHFF